MKKIILWTISILILIIVIFVGNSYYSSPNEKNTTNNSEGENIQESITNTPEEVFPTNELFSNYYSQANEKLNTLSLDEKIGQLFLVRFPDDTAEEILEQYKFGGYLFFEKDFKGKTEEQVKSLMETLQNISNIPLLTAVDEEGGKVVRISSNKNLAESKFKSSMDLYKSGGFEAIREDTINKSQLLSNLGINLNLAPVVDVSTSSKDYMYARSLGEGAELTSTYATTVINASKDNNVSYTLKHFPGYGNNVDTHTGTAIDNRTYEYILNNDLPPFKAGIEAGAEAILISHNVVTSIDKDTPSSLSPKIHELLRNTLNFTGIIITDDLAMGAVSDDSNATVKAVLAGNNLIITTDYEKSISSVKQALQSGEITEDIINNLVFRVLAWKYYKGLIS